MSDKVKQLASVIWAEIHEANNILLHCHPNPDGDSLGSSLALYIALKNLDKNATIIYGDSRKKQQYSCFPCFAEIVEKNFFEIGPENFDLFIACDSSNFEQISKRGNIVFPPSLKTINIDHHISNLNYARINLVETAYPATAQIVYELLTGGKINITAEIALCLYLGIYTDTGGFKYPLTSPDTLLGAAELAKINPNFPQAIFQLENSLEKEQIAYLGLALNSTERYFKEKVAVSTVSYAEMQKRRIAAKYTEKMEVSSILKSVVGWDIGIALVETEPGNCNISLRTRDSEKYDLSRLATALGGGGHKAAAGGSINMPFNEAKNFLLQKIQEVYPFLGKP